MLDLKREFSLVEDEVRAAVGRVWRDQQFVGGPPVAELEEALGRRIGVAHAVAVSSGTDALLCAMMALGLKRGDEVIVPSFTFFATAGSVWRLGAKPVFVDIDPRTFNISPEQVEAAVTPNTKAIVAVHLFGQCADMEAIGAIASRHGLTVIEDAAQAIGAAYRGRLAGTFAALACFSFYPTKNLGGFGEGGMILTDDDDLARRCRVLRNQGQSERYLHDFVGGNFRLDTLQAAILLVKLRRLDEWTKRRRAHAALYNTLLQDLPVETPYVPAGHEPVYHQYSILTDHRDAMMADLRQRGVDTGVYYPVALHEQPCFSSLGNPHGSFPVSERTCSQILSLPCHPMLSEEDVRYVADAIRAFCAVDRPSCLPAGADSDAR